MSGHRAWRPASWMVAASLLAACVDGADPADLDVVRSAHILAAPRFAEAISVAEAPTLDRARVTVLDAGTRAVLAVVEEDVDSTASEWVLEVTLEIPAGALLTVILEVELASTSGATESVEWSGRTAGFGLTAGSDPHEVRIVDLYRGPLANLSVSDLILSGPERVLEGEAVDLSVEVVGGGDSAKVYFESLDPDVAVVSEEGRVQTAIPGLARIVALAGPAADTLALSVREAIEPEVEEIEAKVSPQIEDTAGRITATMADAASAGSIASSLTELGAALLTRDVVDSRSAFEVARAAWAAYGGGSAELRRLDGPQLGLVAITLIHAADALGIPFG